ncbi:MAG: MoxR family ATPase, partial [Clostridia bacterium]|nr:MoxR family ATPase [Clostridia bacterium]
YPLPEAQLDRFSVRMSLGYPSFEDEVRLVADRKTENPMDTVNKITDENEMRAMIRAVSLIRIDERIYRYIVTLVTATRSDERVEVGASPRASIVVSKMAQAVAFMNGRRHVIPEDVASVFLPAVTHRITVKRESRLEGVTAAAVLNDIMKNTAVPSVRAMR